MVLSRLTKITGPGVATDTNWVGNNADFTGITTTATSFNIGVTTIHSNLIEAHNIKSTGIITATGGSFSGNVTAVDGTFSGNVSIAGTLTYEDVTNIDSVGIITAPALDVDDFLDVGSNIKLGNAGVITATSFVGSGAALTGIDATAIKDSGGNVKVQAQASGAMYTGIHTFSSGAEVGSNIKLGNAGVVTATSFTGSGANLTSLPAGQLTGTVADARISTLTASKLSGALPAISGANLTNLDASDLASGTVPTARLGSGTANSSTFLRGDSTFAAVTSTTINNYASTRIVTATNNANELDAETNLTVNGSVVTFANSTLTLNKSTNPTVTVTETAGSKSGQFRANTDGALLRSLGNYPLIFHTNQTERAQIDGSGRFLIGTNSLYNTNSYSNNLIVYENGDAGASIIGNASSSNYASLYLSDTSTASKAYLEAQLGVNGNFTIGAAGSGPIRFVNNGTEKVRIDGNGRLQVNMTSNVTGTAKLEVMGTGDNTYPQYSFAIGVSDTRAYDATTGPGMGIGFTYKHNSAGSYALGCGIRGFKENTTDGNYAGAMAFYTRPNGAGAAEVMRLTSTGRLGIGDIDPDGAIHIKNTNPSIFFEDSDGTHGQAIIEQNGDNLKIRQDAGNASSGSGSNINFQVDGSEHVRINNVGYVAINRTSPSQFLDVDGQSLFRSFLRTGSGGAMHSTAFSGSSVYDTGISVNGYSYGSGMIFIANQNYNAGTGTRSGLYYLKFYYDGNNAPVTYHIAGDNWVTFSKTASNTLGVAFGGGNNMYSFFGSGLNV